MSPVLDDYQLENIANEHGIDASVFAPFVIVRLRDNPETYNASVGVHFRDVSQLSERERRVRFIWSRDSSPTEPLAVQSHTITEWAACGVACALLPLYVGLRIGSVAAYGDRFDYWLRDEQRDYGLEVSGTVSGDLEARHDVKVNQLRDNPHRLDGYVVVVGFDARQAILSFHRFVENTA